MDVVDPMEPMDPVDPVDPVEATDAIEPMEPADPARSDSTVPGRWLPLVASRPGPSWLPRVDGFVAMLPRVAGGVATKVLATPLCRYIM